MNNPENNTDIAQNTETKEQAVEEAKKGFFGAVRRAPWAVAKSLYLTAKDVVTHDKTKAVTGHIVGKTPMDKAASVAAALGGAGFIAGIKGSGYLLLGSACVRAKDPLNEVYTTAKNLVKTVMMTEDEIKASKAEAQVKKVDETKTKDEDSVNGDDEDPNALPKPEVNGMKLVPFSELSAVLQNEIKKAAEANALLDKTGWPSVNDDPDTEVEDFLKENSPRQRKAVVDSFFD